MFFFKDMYMRDDTLEPAYFARKPKSSGSSSGINNEEVIMLQERIGILEYEVETLKEIIKEVANATDHQEITQNDYNELSNEQKLGEVVYFVTNN